MTQDGLESKREQLEELEKSEKEAQRLEEALGRGRGVTSLSPSPPLGPKTNNPSESDNGEQVGDPSEPITSAAEGTAETVEPQRPSFSEDAPLPESPTAAPSSYLPPHPGPNPVRRRTRAPGMGFLNALSFTLHGMMDVDPETARRNGITKTRETIAQVRKGSFYRVASFTDQYRNQLEEALHLSAADLKYSCNAIQGDLDRFQRQKVADLREMCIAMAKSHRDWAKKVSVWIFFGGREADELRWKNLEAWEDAKKEIEKIPDHPNRPPLLLVGEGESGGGNAGAGSVGGEGNAARRDSTATINGR
jgi:hypothetical protein